MSDRRFLELLPGHFFRADTVEGIFVRGDQVEVRALDGAGRPLGAVYTFADEEQAEYAARGAIRSLVYVGEAGT